MFVDFVFFRSVRIISQVFSQCSHYNFPVHVFKWTSCPCQCRTRLEKSIKYSINQIQYEMNQSNTVRNESLKEGLCFGSYFCVVTYHFLPRIRNSKFFQRKSPAMLRCKTCPLQIVHFPFKRKIRMVAHGSHEPDADESWQSRARRG